MPTGLAHLSNERLMQIAEYAGSLLIVLDSVNERDLLPNFRDELVRLEEGACDHLLNRGVIAIIGDDYDE